MGLGGDDQRIPTPILFSVINFRPVKSLKVENSIFKKLKSSGNLYALRLRKNFLSETLCNRKGTVTSEDITNTHLCRDIEAFKALTGTHVSLGEKNNCGALNMRSISISVCRESPIHMRSSQTGKLARERAQKSMLCLWLLTLMSHGARQLQRWPRLEVCDGDRTLLVPVCHRAPAWLFL